jgi:hypothetical protein
MNCFGSVFLAPLVMSFQIAGAKSTLKSLEDADTTSGECEDDPEMTHKNLEFGGLQADDPRIVDDA